jgi:hypothetical protein
MSNVLDFPLSSRERTPPPAGVMAGEIVIFPGIRYEREVPAVDPKPSDATGSRGKARRK